MMLSKTTGFTALAIYQISYDLRRVRHYDKLIDQLRRWGCISPLESVWLGNLLGPASTVRDLLRFYMDGDDGIMVTQLAAGTEWATYAVDDRTAEWLSRNVTPSVQQRPMPIGSLFGALAAKPTANPQGAGLLAALLSPPYRS